MVLQVVSYLLMVICNAIPSHLWCVCVCCGGGRQNTQEDVKSPVDRVSVAAKAVAAWAKNDPTQMLPEIFHIVFVQWHCRNKNNNAGHIE